MQLMMLTNKSFETDLPCNLTKLQVEKLKYKNKMSENDFRLKTLVWLNTTIFIKKVVKEVCCSSLPFSFTRFCLFLALYTIY